MRQKFLFTLLSFLLPLLVQAQELTVKSMEVAPLDLTASTSPVLDKNNQPCALVKVQLAAAGAEFGGNVIKMVPKTGEYWVYMPQNNYQLVVRVPNFLPLTLNFRDYGIQRVEPKTTYVLTLLLPQTAPEVKTQKLIINYSPASATVLIDSKLYSGNGRVEADLPLGEHTYVIAANGYVSAPGSVTLLGGKQRVLNESLEREAAAAQTQTTPVATQQPTTPVVAQPVATTPATPATTGTDSGHAWVDLGLSVCWATTNVGATKPGDYGDYYAWGETSTKEKYDWSTYKYGGEKTLTKYCYDSSYGTVDNKRVLDSSDDVAQVKWGGGWRLPSIEELQELKEKCKWKWTKQDGHKGYRVTGPNGNFIFLPVADSSLNGEFLYGYCWSHSLHEHSPNHANGLLFRSDRIIGTYGSNRCHRESVRPVRLSE